MAFPKQLRLVLAALVVGAAAMPPAGAQNAGPRIEVVGPTRLDLGVYEAEKGAGGTFQLRNAGDALLKIAAVRASCGCTEPVIDKRELPPGETATIRVNMKPMSVFGPFSKTVYVESSDPATPLLRFEVAGTAVPLVEVKPSRRLYNLRIPLAKRWAQAFTLKPAEGKVVNLGAPVVKSAIPVECAMTAAPDGGWRLTVAFEPAAGQGQLQCDIQVPVLAPEGAPAVSLAILARIGPALVVSPNAHQLPAQAAAPVEVPLSLSVEAGDGTAPDPSAVTWTGIDGVKVEFGTPANGRLPGRLIVPPEVLQALPPSQRQVLKFSAPGMEPAEFALTRARPPRVESKDTPAAPPRPGAARLAQLWDRVKQLPPDRRAEVERQLEEWLKAHEGK